MEFIRLIITAIISGLLATIITIFWQRRNAIYNSKLKIFETLMSCRYMITAEESVRALNSIDVIFYKDKKVREAFNNFLDETYKKPELNPNIIDKYLKLLEEIAQTLNLKNIHWDNIKHSYYPNELAEKINEEKTLRKMQIQNNISMVQMNDKQSNISPKENFNQELVAKILPDIIKNPEILKLIMKMSETSGDKNDK